jgi:hypothetical protein
MKKLILATTLIASFGAHAKWVNLDSSDDLTGKVTYQSMSPAIKGKAAVIIRCSGGELDVITTFGTYIDNESQIIKYKVDSGEIMSDYQNPSSSGKALFSHDADSFLSQLAGGKKLILRAQDYRYSSLTATFDIGGIDEELKRIKSKCK